MTNLARTTSPVLGGSLLELLKSYLNDIASIPFDLNMRIALLYLATTIGIAAIVWLIRGRPTSLVKWLFPKNVYTHRSNLLDIKLVFANRALSVLGVFGTLFFLPFITFNTVLGLAMLANDTFAPPPFTWAGSLIATLAIVVTSDFCKYWSHRIQHEWKSLWPFHAVHHSADVLTPLTVLRVHPMEVIIRDVFISILVGVVQGIVIFAVIGDLSLLTIGGANAIYVTFNALGSNLRHSHIWLSYGRTLEHVFISPAQHQIHHSVAVKHHDKNYGSIFALWDWMFGTLYIPEAQEDLTFGVSDEFGQLKEQPHKTLFSALLTPFVESWSALRLREAQPSATPGETSTDQ